MSKFNSFLEELPEIPDTHELKSNDGLSFHGVKIYGNGFVLTPDEKETLINKDPKNAERIFKYIGGKEVNSHSEQKHHRYVISFDEMSEQEAQQWPDLYEIVKEKVKPERDKNNREGYRKHWWQSGGSAPKLYRALAPLERCLVAAQATKHLCFTLMEKHFVFSDKLIVFSMNYIFYSVLQSRIHELWGWKNSSTLGVSTLNYGPTACFRNFPFPQHRVK